MRRSTDERRAAQWEAVASAEARPPVPVARSGVVLLRPSSALTRDQLVATLKEFSGALEDRLRVIDTGIPCDPFGEVDLLGVDRSNQLVIIDVETSPSEALLVRGVNHVDWIARNIAIVRRMYQGSVINFSAPPRLVLVAPQFSSSIRSAVRQMTGRQIECVRYHGADASGSDALLLEPVDDEP
jgi:RecB family endonuclease NucS